MEYFVLMVGLHGKVLEAYCVSVSLVSFLRKTSPPFNQSVFHRLKRCAAKPGSQSFPLAQKLGGGGSHFIRSVQNRLISECKFKLHRQLLCPLKKKK